MAETRDVVELILRDHRKMEDLFRLMRSVEADRAAALREFADLLIAHAQAEEAGVYPALKRYKKIEDDEIEHGEEEHEEGNRALLELLEVDEVGSEEWDAKLEELVEAVTHHADEEERTILNGARENVAMERREELGGAFLEERERRLKEGCGAVDNVRRTRPLLTATATGRPHGEARPAMRGAGRLAPLPNLRADHPVTAGQGRVRGLGVSPARLMTRRPLFPTPLPRPPGRPPRAGGRFRPSRPGGPPGPRTRSRTGRRTPAPAW